MRAARDVVDGKHADRVIRPDGIPIASGLLNPIQAR